MEVLSSTPIKQSFKSPSTSCNMCTVTAKTRNIPGNAPTTDDSQSSLQTKHCHSYSVVPSTSSCITPVKYNMTTIKQVLSILTNWPHFLSYTSASSSVSLRQGCPHLGYNIAQVPSILTNWPHFLSYISASSSVSLRQGCPHLGYNIAQVPAHILGITLHRYLPTSWV
jgi:hypothetical protein